jgi:hypothetical protein
MKVNEHEIFRVVDQAGCAVVVESRTPLPVLSQEARVPPKEASQDSSGRILFAKYIGGTTLQTSGKNLIFSSERRAVARWEQLLLELRSNDLVAERGNGGEIFELTDRAYQIADMMAL